MDLIRVSAGTACQLKLKEILCDELPTTGYLMDTQRCKSSCDFCSQGSNSTGPAHRLSRVTWPEFDIALLRDVLKGEHPLKRLCLQVTNYQGVTQNTVDRINKIKESSSLPLCISGGAKNLEEIKQLLDAGADKVSLSIDAANPEIFKRIKKKDWHKLKKLILDAANVFPKQISTHIIIGLGETAKEAIDLIKEMHEAGVTVALFAFTPVRGTAMEKLEQPDITYYRRVQLISHLYKEGIVLALTFNEYGEITKIGHSLEETLKLVADGTAFRTSGCDDCNRPYYNEKPGKLMYNYPRPLSAEEIQLCIEQLNLDSLEW